MIFRNLLLLVSAFFAYGSENPSIRVRVTRKGLDYVNNLAAKYLETQLVNREIPFYQSNLGTNGEAKLTLEDVRVINFNTPDIGYKLIPPSRILWASKGGDMEIEGNFKMEVSRIVRLRGSGSLKANISGINFEVSAEALSDPVGQPVINITSCTADIGSIDINFSGGLMAWALNKFKQTINQKVSQLLTRTIVSRVTMAAEHIANGRLKTLPMMVPLSHGAFEKLVMDYRMARDVSVTENYVDFLHRGEVTVRGSRTISYPPVPLPESDRNDHMVLVWISQYTINSLLSSMHKQGLLRIQIDKENFPNMADGLRTTCEEEDQCIGGALKSVARAAPNQWVTVKLATQAPPNCTIIQGYSGPKITGKLLGITSIVNETGENILFTFDVNYWVSIVAKVQKGRLVGKVRIVTLSTDNYESYIGRLNPLGYTVVESYVSSKIETTTNAIMRKGIDIPGLSVLKYEYPEVVMDTKSILAYSNMYYTPV